jgi:hypothetical protein
VITFALLLAAPVSDVEPPQLNAYVDCLYDGDREVAAHTAGARLAAANHRLRRCSALRAAAVKALPFYKPRFQLIDANFRKSVTNAQD